MADAVRPNIPQFAPVVGGMLQSSFDLPPWIGDEAFHLSHRSNLVRKHPEFYRELFCDVPDELPLCLARSHALIPLSA